MTIPPEAVLEALRAACVAAARDAWETAGIQGLCIEGRWEAVVDALETLDLASIRATLADGGGSPSSDRG